MEDESDAGRRWLPSHWLDEVNPRLEPTPDAFIFKGEAGFRLRCPADSPDHDDENLDDPLDGGQIVEFCWYESYGIHTITVAADGSWSCPTSWPAKASHFWLPYDSDTLADSMDELVKGEAWGGPLEPGDLKVGVYFWSEGVSFRFDAAEAKFVQSVGVS